MRRTASRLWVVCWFLALAVSCEGSSHGSDGDASVLSESILDSTEIVMTGGPSYADTSVRSAVPDANEGSSSNLDVGPSAIGLVRFDANEIAALLDGRVLREASLVLATNNCSLQTYSVHRMLEPFDEATSTWACRVESNPGDGSISCTTPWGTGWGSASGPHATAATSEDTLEQLGDPLVFDVTNDVFRLLADPSTAHGWAVRGPSGGNACKPRSREAGTALAPRLVLKYESDPEFAPTEPTAPALDRGTPTHVYAAMSWLVDPDYGLQWGVTDPLDPDRASLIRGRVLGRDAMPVSGVRVSIAGRPERGATRTRLNKDGVEATGTFELLVNGGGPMTIEFRHPDYLPVQRTVDVPWNDWISVPEIVLTPRDAMVCASVGASGGFAFGAELSNPDGRGKRWTGAYVPAGTEIDVDRDGVGDYDEFDICMVEMTVGTASGDPCTNDAECETGICRSGACRPPLDADMPGELPATTSYTFAADYEVRVGGIPVPEGYEFVGPSAGHRVFAYVRGDELASFKQGQVPVGTYDATRGAWLAGDDGVIITVNRAGGCSITPSLPVDEETAICGQPDRFGDGERFWRAPVRHFSPLDLNYLLRLLGLLPRPSDTEGAKSPDCLTENPGSVIHCENQALGERVPLVGTGGNLSYVSTHQTGRADAFTARFTPITDATLAVDPDRVRVELLVAGRRIPASGSPFTATEARNEQYAMWDGLDAYGRRMIGVQLAYLRIGYEYDSGYVRPAAGSERSFGRAYSVTAGDVSDTGSATFWVTTRVPLGVLDDRESGLGGWRLEGHHAYDPATGTLFYSNGTQRTAQSTSGVTDTLAPVLPSTIQGLAVGPDGTAYFYWNGRLHRRRRAATANEAFGPATGTISSAPGLALSRDGRVLYAADPNNDRVYRVDVETGAFDELVGDGTDALPTADVPTVGPASVQLSNPRGVAVGLDGSIYIAASGNNRVLRYVPGPRDVIGGARDDSESLLEIFAGATCTAGDTRALCTPAPGVYAVAVGPDGSVYFNRGSGSGYQPAIVRVTPDGLARVHVGGGAANADVADGAIAACTTTNDSNCARISASPNIYALALDRSGDLCFAQRPLDVGLPTQTGHRVRCVRSDGRVYTIAGLNDAACSLSTGDCWTANESGYASTRTTIAEIGSVAWSPDGRLFYADQGRLRVVRPLLDASLIAPHLIASEDGSILYEFSEGGRHLRTLDGVTHTELVEFDYRTDGRLAGFWDREGAYTSIAYLTSPNRIVITAPGSLATTLTLGTGASSGYVTSIANPAGDVRGGGASPFLYHASLTGLLTRFTDALGREHLFTYQADGRLRIDRDAPDDPGGPTTEQELLYTRMTDHQRVERDDAAEHTTTYRFGYAGDPRRQRIETATGAFRDSTRSSDGRASTSTDWTGTTVTTTTAPDPVLAGASRLARLTISRPEAGASETTFARTRTNSASWTQTDSMTNGDRTFAQTTAFDDAIDEYTVVSNSESADPSRRVTTVLDSRGRVTQISIPGQHPICVSYASATSDRPSDVIQAPLSGGTCNASATPRRHTHFDYHPTRRWLVGVTQQGETTTLTPDDRGWTTSALLPGRSDVVDIERDAEANLRWIETPGHSSSQRHEFAYTGRDLPDTYTPPAATYSGAQIVSTTYMLDGQPDQITLRDGRVVDYGYEPDGRVSSVGGTSTFPDDAIAVQLDAGGRLASVARGTQALNREYDGDLLQSETWSGLINGVVEHWSAPNWTGSVLATETVSFDASPEQVVSHELDDDMWPSGVSISPALPSVVLSYSTNARAVVTGDIESDESVSAFGEIALLDYTDASTGTTLMRREVCRRDANGRIEAVLETTSSGTRREEYDYDAAGRLEGWRQIPGCSTCGATCSGPWTTYAYDDAGNRLTHAPNAEDQPTVGGRTYNAIGQLSSRSYGASGTGTFAHDRFGHLRRFTLGSTAHTYVYDGAGRLVGVEEPSGAFEEFLYRDALEPIGWRRHWLSGSTWIDDYAYFGYASRPHAPDAMWIDRGGDGTIDFTYRIVLDERGSVRRIVDLATGSVVQSIDYDPWGVPTFGGAVRAQPFGFAGGIYLPAPQLWHFGARDYDSALGRWTTKDPILFRGGLNLYEYAGSDPVNRADPSGLFVVAVGGTFGAALGHGVAGGTGVYVDIYRENNSWHMEYGVYFSGSYSNGVSIGAGAGVAVSINPGRRSDFEGVAQGFGVGFAARQAGFTVDVSWPIGSGGYGDIQFDRPPTISVGWQGGGEIDFHGAIGKTWAFPHGHIDFDGGPVPVRGRATSAAHSRPCP
ncbi:RHS repeat-associated core domain-containing protein [Sandaracinus amylolyticus]|uniref:RHS repeat-associated core domain-containing protein n=1 Tax=Sandaracinus amylolyticus TaxID=927083 RepID=UPI001F2F7F37|nr:RHS repeat-associated core domain-containing protein [Sandaracinus amylolyticus]UJR83690.1 Hypothetical protein I5071_57590 [Sandaracinus amylolyticus]